MFCSYLYILMDIVHDVVVENFVDVDDTLWDLIHLYLAQEGL